MSNNVISRTNFDVTLDGFDILLGIETHKVRGFLDINFDGNLDVLISSERLNDGPDKYNPTTPQTLNPSGLYAFDISRGKLMQLPGLYYSPLAINIFDIDNNGFSDIVVFDSGDESTTHSYEVEGVKTEFRDLTSVGYLTSEILFTESSYKKSDLINDAIYQYRKSDQELFGSRIQSLSPFFQDNPSEIPDDIWKYLMVYNVIVFDFDGDGWDDIFLENGGGSIGGSQLLLDGKSGEIDKNFSEVWDREYIELIGIGQRFISYTVSASSRGSVWIAAGTMKEENTEKSESYRNILMEMEKTPNGWVAHSKYALPLPGWADDFTQVTEISLEVDQNSDPRFIYLVHSKDQTNDLGYFVGTYIQALSIDPVSGLISDVTSEKIPYQSKSSALFRPDGSINRVNPRPEINSQLLDVDLNNDGFNDLVFLIGNIKDYSQSIWVNTGAGTFMPATEIYLDTDLKEINPQFIADSDSDDLIEFWTVFELKSTSSLRIERTEITDFRNDLIFGSLPVEMHLSGFNGAYLLSVLEIDPTTVNRENYVSVFDNVIASVGTNIHMFAPGAKVHGFENYDDIISLREGNEVAFGYTGNDHITGNEGNDLIYGGGGVDFAYFSGEKDEYSIFVGASRLEITDSQTDRDGKDDLIEVERVIFSDSGFAFDLDRNAGFAAKLLGAFLGPEGLTNHEYVGIALGLIDSGLSNNAILAEALKVVFGNNPSGADLINGFYRNLTGEEAPPTLLNEYVRLIDSGELTPLGLANQVLDHEINAANINLIGLASTGLEFI